MEGTDFALFKSRVVSNESSNGERMSHNRITSGVLNNIFPNASQTERTNGVTKYRKVYFKNSNALKETSVNSRVWISQRSTGGDYFRLKAGTNTDIQSDAEAYVDWVGTGWLTSPLSIDSTTLEAKFDAENGVYDGSLLMITDNSGGEEFLTVKPSGGVVWGLNNAVTIHTTSPSRGIYPASQNSLVSAALDLGDIVAETSDWAETTASGTYDEATYPVEVNNVGTVTDTWTLAFTSSNNFTVSGVHTGLVGTGSRASNFSPINPNVGTGSLYFRIRSEGWGGTWAIGETVTFKTTHSAEAVWIKEVVPPGTSALASNEVRFMLYGEGA